MQMNAKKRARASRTAAQLEALLAHLEQVTGHKANAPYDPRPLPPTGRQAVVQAFLESLLPDCQH